MLIEHIHWQQREAARAAKIRARADADESASGPHKCSYYLASRHTQLAIPVRREATGHAERGEAAGLQAAREHVGHSHGLEQQVALGGQQVPHLWWRVAGFRLNFDRVGQVCDLGRQDRHEEVCPVSLGCEI